MNYFFKSTEETLEELKTSKHGLNKEQVKEKQAKYGKNELPAAKQDSIFKIFISQF